ncbi:zinc-binding alcohol dehydrogenase [Exiguobacterium sp. SH3S2]|uniref:zinc-binding dehydrogenase n=1 Tax=Exiguobacterium TaxID=33986 RepID=UPI0008777BF5|nr:MULTISPECIES: zinc-binding dehydrogenase [Exiguobacterium]TCI44865.1 zinc-binding alcohol dehydrogenase [Exiguobacterium sp. SH3S3]TCI53929.1 zinc-binding alcohol dehydrogenase [Exiguobacterium sp. SH5S13]TCI60286.1 zinc-binding alcohol dehydrogenase [Exiguobacterium sp. SH3S2]TCI64251.1 zinc-binding alcohol dehydrogenase [Exiguobacterium sp. SH3S1]
MKAWLLEQPGLDNMNLGDIERPTPGAGELLIKVEAVALNPVDYKVGTNGNPNWAYPHILGVDLVGEVVEVGSSIANIITGSRVAVHTSLANNGGFAEYAVVDARACAVVPQDVSDEAAAAILCAGMTAYEAVMQKLNTRDKETILVHAGAGGVGGYAIQLAKKLGLKVFTTASPENFDWVTSLGADVAIDYNVEDVTERIMELTDGRGVDLILNTVGRDVATADLDRLAFSGQLAHIAGPPDMSNMKGFTLSPSIHEVALGAAHASEDERAIRNLAYMAEELMKLLETGELNDLVTDVLPFDRLKDGLEQLQTRKVRGKLIVRVRD